MGVGAGQQHGHRPHLRHLPIKPRGLGDGQRLSGTVAGQADGQRCGPELSSLGKRKMTDAVVLLRAVGVDQHPVQEDGHVLPVGIELQDGIALKLLVQYAGEIEGLPGMHVAGEAAKAIRCQRDGRIALLHKHLPAFLVVYPTVRHGFARPAQGQIIGHRRLRGLHIAQQPPAPHDAENQQRSGASQPCCFAFHREHLPFVTHSHDLYFTMRSGRQSIAPCVHSRAKTSTRAEAVDFHKCQNYDIYKNPLPAVGAVFCRGTGCRGNESVKGNRKERGMMTMKFSGFSFAWQPCRCVQLQLLRIPCL